MRHRKFGMALLRRSFRRPMRASVGSAEGTALIECALALPVLLILMLNAANFGIYIYGWITVNNAARAAVQYQIYNGTVVGAPGMPTTTQLENLVYTDSLLTSSKVGIEICSKNNGTVACDGTLYTCGTGTACSASQNLLSSVADPEPTLFTLWGVDLYYAYTPLFSSAFALVPGGSSCTIVANGTSTTYSTCIHRQVVMRSMQ